MSKTNKCKKRDVAFYIGLVSAVYHAVVHTGIAANVSVPWWVGAIGVAISAAFMYLNGMMTGKAASVPGANAAAPAVYTPPSQYAAAGAVEELLIGNYADDEFAQAAAPDEEERED